MKSIFPHSYISLTLFFLFWYLSRLHVPAHQTNFNINFYINDNLTQVMTIGYINDITITIPQVRFISWNNGKTFRIFRQRADFLVTSIIASRPGPEAAKGSQTIILTQPYLTVSMIFLWNAVVGSCQMYQDTNLPKSSTFFIDLSWSKWGLQFFRCCSRSFFGTSWMSCWCAFAVILVGLPLLGRLTTVTNVLQLWIMAITVVCWNPKALEMVL